MIALDENARVLRYANGVEPTRDLALCPGSRRVVDLSWSGAVYTFAVRELPSLRIVRRARMRIASRESIGEPVCRSAGATDVLAWVADRNAFYTGGEWRVVQLGGGEPRVVWRGEGRSLSLAGARAYLTREDGSGALIVEVELGTGATRTLARVPRDTASVTPSPDGRVLAALTYPDIDAPNARPPEVVAVELETGTVRTSQLDAEESPGLPIWIDDGRFLVTPSFGESLVRVYDLSLRLVASIERWEAWETVVADGVAYGIGPGYLLRADLPSGPARLVRTFVSPEVSSLAVVGAPAPPASLDGYVPAGLRCGR